MKFNRKIKFIAFTALVLSVFSPSCAKNSQNGNSSSDSSKKENAASSNMFENSDFIETEQPELSAETKALIAEYQADPTEENYLNLRNIVISNYNEVLVRKENKLAELREETSGKPGGLDKVSSMEEIVQEIYTTYWSRINSTMLRFTDTRLLKWHIEGAARHEYIPVMGAGESIYVKRTPVTNSEYKKFIEATNSNPPVNWKNGTFTEGEEDFPVNFVSFYDAQKYCEWLTLLDGKNTYRIPDESEWQLAAGHMPKDAEFNCGINDGRTSVYEYDGITRGAHGAIDFWGNVWEWTATVRENSLLAVKGGSWFSPRTDCRTEHQKESRDSSYGYEDVGFRVIQVKDGIEPAQKVELTTLPAPKVTASSSENSVTLFWNKIPEAVEYQIFEYFERKDSVKMLCTTAENSITITGLENESTHFYIVQAVSYIEISANVSGEYAVKIRCK